MRLISTAAQSHAQLAAENLFLRKQLALYVERRVKPRRADAPRRVAHEAVKWTGGNVGHYRVEDGVVVRMASLVSKPERVRRFDETGGAQPSG
jgi:hypothetical protein